MGAWSGREEKRKRSLPAIPFYFAAMLVTGSNGFHGGRPSGDVLQILSRGEISVDSFVEPVSRVDSKTSAALDDEGDFLDPSDRPHDLPVWPPPARKPPVDPAKDPLIGAPPQHVDWPAGLASVQAPPKPAASASRKR